MALNTPVELYRLRACIEVSCIDDTESQPPCEVFLYSFEWL